MQVTGTITGTTRVFFILGDPVAQERAPELFNHLFQRHGIDAVLVPAGVAQAVNAVRRHADGTLEGPLFDGLGFVKSLDGFGVACAGQRVLVVGVGGAGTAVAVSLAERGVAQLSLYGLDRPAVQAVATRIAAAFAAVRVQVASRANPAAQDLVVNATPLGLRVGDPLAFDPTRLQPGAAVVDILMKNQPTPLLQACAAQGARVYPGFEMMIRQAPDYLDFFGLHELARTVEADAGEVRQLITQH